MSKPFGIPDNAPDIINSLEQPGEKMSGWWSYSINYGPDGEENYANVYDVDESLVGNLRIHHARAVVSTMNEALRSPPAEIEPVAWRWQTSYTHPDWHYAEKVSFAPHDIERGFVKNVTPLFASPAHLQGENKK